VNYENLFLEAGVEKAIAWPIAFSCSLTE